MKPVLVILAAGLGSRYGGIKQLEAVGPNKEAIIDYSVYDAIKAGFGKVVFIIRKELEKSFQENLLKRFENRIETGYVFQEPDMLPEGYTLPPDRKKPWGTAHAVLAAEQAVRAPFIVINADDFYGFEAFQAMHEFLTGDREETDFAMPGYPLVNTLSEHGSVSRGVCDIDEQGYLKTVTEVTKIYRDGDSIVYEKDGDRLTLPEETIVSMNMWGFSPLVFRYIKDGFRSFLDDRGDDPKAEYYIPTLIDRLIKTGEAQVKVLQCNATWFGITYKEDLKAARQTIMKKIESGEYPRILWD